MARRMKRARLSVGIIAEKSTVIGEPEHKKKRFAGMNESRVGGAIRFAGTNVVRIGGACGPPPPFAAPLVPRCALSSGATPRDELGRHGRRCLARHRLVARVY